MGLGPPRSLLLIPLDADDPCLEIQELLSWHVRIFHCLPQLSQHVFYCCHSLSFPVPVLDGLTPPLVWVRRAVEPDGRPACLQRRRSLRVA